LCRDLDTLTLNVTNIKFNDYLLET